MSFATWSIRNPVPVTLLFFLLVLGGLYSFYLLPIKNMPDFQQPEFSVALDLPGASPDQLEVQVARPVENAFAEMRHVRSIQTTITDGSVVVLVRFSEHKSVTRALLDMRSALNGIQQELPANLEKPFYHQLSASVGYPSITYSVTSNQMTIAALTWFVENTVGRAIHKIPGARKFNVIGGVSREIEVKVDPTKLLALGLTVSDVSQALGNTQEETSGGESHIGGENQGIRTSAMARRAASIAKLPIALPDGEHIALGSIAHIRDAYAEPATAATYDGKTAVGFDVYDNYGGNELALIRHVKAAVAVLQKTHPEVRFELVHSESGDIYSEYYQSMRMLIEGALLAALVLWLFLRSVRSTLLGAIALPLSILPAFIFMHLAGYTLNTDSLLALLVVAGILVDDAIVEVENIYRHLKPGGSLREATERAVSDIGLAVIATSLTLVVVFLPVSFLSGFTGEIFREFGWTACAAVLASLLVARLITPLLAIRILKPDHVPPNSTIILPLYTKALRWCLRYRVIIIALTAVIIGISIYLYKVLPTGFIPPSEENYTTVNIHLAPGATLSSTLAVATKVRHAIIGGSRPVFGVTHIFTRVGESRTAADGGPGVITDIRNAKLTILFSARGTHPPEAVIEAEIRKRVRNIPGAEISVNGETFGSSLQITLASANPAILEATARRIERQMRTIPGLASVASPMGLQQTDVYIHPKLAVAAALGVTTQAIAHTVRIATSGDYPYNLPKFNLDDRQIYIRVRLPYSYESSLSAIRSLRVPGRNGLVPLSAVARVSLENQPIVINRYDRERLVTISADLAGMPLGEAYAKVAELPAMRTLPQGVHWIKTGEGRIMDELFANFGQALLMSALCVYALLVLLFNDPFQPLTILCAAPLSAIGALLGVWVSGSAIELPVFLGFVMLLGLATKNSILIVDHAQRAILQEGVDHLEAIVEACRARARPIVMTTVAMTAGMVPLMISIHGEDVTFSSPLAATVIGGLLTSTALSLFVVPVVYLYIAQLERFVRRQLSHWTPTNASTA